MSGESAMKRRRTEGNAGHCYGQKATALAIGSDHAGFALKAQIIAYVKEKYAGKVSVTDCGAYSEDRVDYPDIAAAVCGLLVEGACDRGILLDGAGVASGIAANKFNGIRAGVVHDHFSVCMARKHNDCNVICLGGKTLGIEAAKEIVDVHLCCDFEGDRHIPRLKKVESIERFQTSGTDSVPSKPGNFRSPFKLPN